MKILSIGNSFSQDAQRWLHDIAASAGIDLECRNLYIGGCSLTRHWNNYLSGEAAYTWEVNGRAQGEISLPDALRRENWDAVTVQQVSSDSGIKESFTPYLQSLAAAVRSVCPDTKLCYHETWSYPDGSSHPAFEKYARDQKLMYEKIKECSLWAADEIHAEILPVGDVIEVLRENKGAFDPSCEGISLNRDGFHLTLDYGRYAAGLTWFCRLCSCSADAVSFSPAQGLVHLDEIKSAVNRVLHL